MQHKRLAYGLLAAFAAVAKADDASDVAQLTKDTFDDFVKGNDLVLAECKFLCPSQHHGTPSSRSIADSCPLI